MSRKAARAGGRASRIAARTAPVSQFRPCPPGQVGGQYRPLDDTALGHVLDTAFRILAEIGMGEAPLPLVEAGVAKGATMSGEGRLTFPRGMVEDIIDGAATSFVFHGRDAAHDFEVGGERVYYGTGGAAVQTLDMDSGEYRASTLRDLYDFTRLVDTLDNVSWFTRCCVATDVEDIFDLDINTAYALLAGTRKPLGMSFSFGSHVDAVVDMFDIAAGGEGRFRARPFCKAHISPVISPLRYGEDAFDVILACIRHGMPINAIIAAQSGATAPATLAGMLAQSTAETLAALVEVNMLAPGHPIIFSNWPFVIDLRTGAFSGSGGEISLLNAAAAQIANHLGLPSGVASSMADAKAVDAQMGSEKALSALAAGLAGGNMIYESSGMMASLLGASFEAFVADNEMLSHVYRMLRGIEVNEETLGFEAIRDCVAGDGHFLGAEHTMDAMQRDYFYPELADRVAPAVWAEQGKADMWSRARAKAKETLGTHYPEYLSKQADAAMRERYRILLDPAAMRPAG
jgi:trimethylamine--corrinoid protein Co-methyltransferase